MGACSISNATPSNDEPPSALAVSMSADANPTKAVLPSARALMTPLSRGISGMATPPGHEFGHPHVEDGGHPVALHRREGAANGRGHLVGVGDLFTVRPARRRLPGVVRTGIEPAPREVALLGRIPLGIRPEHFVGAGAI